MLDNHISRYDYEVFNGAVDVIEINFTFIEFTQTFLSTSARPVARVTPHHINLKNIH